MKNLTIASLAALALAACGGGDEAATNNVTAAPSDQLLPGNFEITTEVTDLASTDGSTPGTESSVGQTQTTSVCVGEDGLLPASVFGEDGDDCTIENPYVRRGTLRQELVCQRSGRGEVRAQISANFTEDSVEGDIRTNSFFAGDGDYRMTKTITGTRTGDCSPAEADQDLQADVNG